MCEMFTRVLLNVTVKTVVLAYLVPKSDATLKSKLDLTIISPSGTLKISLRRPGVISRSDLNCQQNLRLCKSDMSSRHKIRRVSLTWPRGKACCSKGMRNRQFHADAALL
jgi:hypothetical protein